MASNKKAAGLRQSALAERARLQAEWAELKGDDSSNVLRGVVALVDVGEGSKAIALRAALSALGATVVPEWSPLVTHVVWTPEGCRQTRAKARSLAAHTVSPLWVEACASASRRLPEHTFPSATRPSDLLSPRTLRRMLTEAQKENLTLDTSDSPKEKLRYSTENEDSSIDVPSRVNTAPRRALPASGTPEKKSRRKLFTYKEGVMIGSDCSGDEEPQPKPARRKAKPPQAKPSERKQRDLAEAERMARRLANLDAPRPATQSINRKPRIVLTGMSRNERSLICENLKKLDARLQSKVTKKTTHIVMGNCTDNVPNITGVHPFDTLSHIFSGTKNTSKTTISGTKNTVNNKLRTLNALEGAARGCRVLNSDWVLDSAKEGHWVHPYGYEVPHLKKLSERARVERSALRRVNHEYAYDVFNGLKVQISEDTEQKDAALRLLTLCGATVCDKGGIKNGEGMKSGGASKTRDVISGSVMKSGDVMKSRDVMKIGDVMKRRDVMKRQDVIKSQDVMKSGGSDKIGALISGSRIKKSEGMKNRVVILGRKPGDVVSKWVFDSVAACRVRDLRRYVIPDIGLPLVDISNDSDIFLSLS